MIAAIMAAKAKADLAWEAIVAEMGMSCVGYLRLFGSYARA